MTRLSRLSAVILTIAAVVAVAAPAAFAAWNITATSPTANAKASSIGAVTGLGSTVTSSSVTLTWTAPTGVAATGYTVSRGGNPLATCTNISLTTCTETGLSASTAYTYSVVALRNNWVSTATTTTATTSAAATPNFLLTPAAGPYTAGTAFSVTVQARLGTVNDPTYTGNKTLSISAPTAPDGTSSATMTASPVSFDATGKATVSVTLYKATTSNTFTISDNGTPARSGSATVNVGTALPRLSFSACTNNAKSVVKNTNFSTSVTRTGADPYGNSTGTATVTVTLSPYDATASNNNFTTQTVSFTAGALTSSTSVNYETANGAGTATITGNASGYADASCTVTTTN